MKNEKGLKVLIAGLEVELRKKAVKSIRIVILPPEGQVIVTAPFGIADDTLASMLGKRREWIQKHRERMSKMPRPPRLDYAEGESLRLFGQDYVISLADAQGWGRVLILGKDRVEIRARAGSGREERAKLVEAWYRSELKKTIGPLVAKWEGILGVKVAEWGVKKMKTRWGTCNPRASRIWLSLELARRSPECLEYVVVHEMAHLIEKSHGTIFKAILDKALPTWRETQLKLAEEGRFFD